jgi:hypothetical protein
MAKPTPAQIQIVIDLLNCDTGCSDEAEKEANEAVAKWLACQIKAKK